MMSSSTSSLRSTGRIWRKLCWGRDGLDILLYMLRESVLRIKEGLCGLREQDHISAFQAIFRFTDRHIFRSSGYDALRGRLTLCVEIWQNLRQISALFVSPRRLWRLHRVIGL
jgi:hypothetical protein